MKENHENRARRTSCVECEWIDLDGQRGLHQGQETPSPPQQRRVARGGSQRCAVIRTVDQIEQRAKRAPGVLNLAEERRGLVRGLALEIFGRQNVAIAQCDCRVALELHAKDHAITCARGVSLDKEDRREGGTGV